MAAEEIDNINTFALVLAENPDGSGRRVEIQRALTFDEQDRQNGHDTYCVCTDTGAAHYGGIVDWLLGDTNLHIVFDDVAATVLGAKNLVIKFSAEHHSKLNAALARLLNDV